MYSVYGDGICIYNDLHLADSVNGITPKLNLADNTAGSLEITLPVGNAGYEVLERIYSEIVVKRYGEDIWAGRIISEKKNFRNSRILTCEGELAYLNDTTQPPTEYTEVDIYDFIEDLLMEHNRKVETDKIFEITKGIITVHGTVSCVTNNETTLESINKNLIEKFGGHIRIRRVYDEYGDAHRYFDYLADYPNTNGQTIRFGKNLLDFTRNWDMSEYATVIMPRGAKLDSSPIESIDAYLDVSSVNGGSRYVTNEVGIMQYGWIEKVVDWNDVTEPSELLQKAEQYLTDKQYENLVLEVSAVDMCYLSQGTQPINLLDNVRCISKPHGLDKLFPVTQLSIQLDSPENSTYTLGDTTKESTLTESTRAANDAMLDKISEIPNEKKILDKAKDNASAIMNMATQGYVTIIQDQNGSEYLAISSESATTAYDPEKKSWKAGTKLWKWSASGLGYSKDGGENYDLAIMMDGSIVADYITTGTMSADRIRTGILESSESYDEWSETRYYSSGNAVTHNNKTWRAVRYVEKGKEPGVVAWSETSTTTGATEWSWDVEYKKGAIVLYNDKYWIAVVANKSYYPGATYWVQISKKNVTFDLNNGSLSILSGNISLGVDENGSYRFQVTDDGYLTAEYGKIGGFTISAWSIYNDAIRLDSNGLTITKIVDGASSDVGYFGSQYWAKNPNNYGLVMNIFPNYKYVGWFQKKTESADSSTMKLMYTDVDLDTNDGSVFKAGELHLGADLNLNGYSIRNYNVSKDVNYIGLTTSADAIWLLYSTDSSGTSWNTLKCKIIGGVVMRSPYWR